MSKKTMHWLCLGAIVLAVLAGFAVLGIYQLRFRIQADPLEQYEVLEAGRGKFAWELEENRMETGTLVASGWLVEPGKEYRKLNGGTGTDNVGVYNCVWVALLDETDGRVYRLPTQARLPEDGDPYPQDGIDHKNCAFYSEAEAESLIQQGADQICLAIKTLEGDWYLARTEVQLTA